MEASREVVIEIEREKGPADLVYCLSCLSFWLTSWLCGAVAYIMAYKAEKAKKYGDSLRFKLFSSVGISLGVIGIIIGLAVIVLFHRFIYPVWYRYLYMSVEPEYVWE
ncbi:uncharacterized protein LOC133183446 [Saccostrea echinata]|uniref:uncharacterized protein LOC133183446 n=1 Tax=Saccostrea echinata TaxID=191078 RepID=UPI002A81B0E7|nr:uncharacterized protein LOC133183446 [Saccostrea echinata]XP_061174390.1 uncharacterized protein LOC133183446 [Saccostrea echinata]